MFKNTSRRCGAAVLAVLIVAPGVAEAKRNIYVSSSGSDDVRAYDSTQSGQLFPLAGPSLVGNEPRGVALTPDGTRLYVANTLSNNISGFSVAANGSLAPLPGSPFPVGTTGPRGVAVSPDGKRLYTANTTDISGFTIAADGSLAALPASPYTDLTNPQGIAISPGGTRLYTVNTGPNSVSGYSIAGDGSLAALPSSPFTVGAGAGPSAVAMTPDGTRLYTANSGSNNVSGFNVAADGSLAALPSSPFPTGANTAPLGITVSPDGTRLYTANTGATNNISGFTIAADGSLGALPGQPYPAGGIDPQGISLTPDGRRLYTANTGSNDVSGFDVAANGSLVPIPNSPFTTGAAPDFQSLAITPNQGPTATASVSSVSGMTAAFSAAGSSDPDGSVARYDWDFGDGTTLANGGPTPSHTYGAIGTYAARLTVTDNEGCSTALVFTGQTAYCNGATAAAVPVTVTIGEDTAVNTPIVRAKRKQKQRGDTITVELKAGAAEQVAIVAKGDVTTEPGRSYKLRKVRAVGRPGRLTKLTMEPKRGTSNNRIGAALADGDSVKAKLTVRLKDAAGNVATKRLSVTLLP